ncbi:unnamed protein product [Caenorhabditis bovis]|uniref:Pseudouridine-5'-phosphate glycosidase n=1 Tax=Caenorhabditis bovis TaxID=2654633 RepID=A0A8S1EIH8_9PELO|nr:unnamed protein product [Caenorhabditis bovis]
MLRDKVAPLIQSELSLMHALLFSTTRSVLQRRQFSNYLKISRQVREALINGEGVVALESTVITHGLPYPHNLTTARELEEQVKQSGSQPATIAILNNEIHVGLDDEKLETIASSRNSVKVSTRDIAKTLAQNLIGGTTVASTMRIANAAGIQIFATGGIGGVHRGADQTFDISADLQELSRTPVCVVCSGVKSILDIPKTVEYLETHSVNCIVLGEENIFPSFFTRHSSSKGQFNCTDLKEVIKIIQISSELGLPSGTVLACPIPEDYAADGNDIQEAINKAIQESIEKKIASQQVTPFLLARINELTKGASMKTNIALLKNNAKIAGNLAKLLAQTPRRIENFKQSSIIRKAPKVVTVGATIVDWEAITHETIKVS